MLLEVIPVWAASIAIVTVDDDALEDRLCQSSIVSAPVHSQYQ